MLRLIGLAIPFCLTLSISGWQEPAPKPNFSGSWQLDTSKSKADVKEELVWKIDQKSGDIVIEEISLGKSLCTAKCSIGKPCEFDDHGRKMTAMTYFLDTTLVQMRSAGDNSSVVKRQLKMESDGSMKVEQITIVPSDKTEVLVFTKKAAVADAKDGPGEAEAAIGALIVGAMGAGAGALIGYIVGSRKHRTLIYETR